MIANIFLNSQLAEELVEGNGIICVCLKPDVDVNRTRHCLSVKYTRQQQ